MTTFKYLKLCLMTVSYLMIAACGGGSATAAPAVGNTPGPSSPDNSDNSGGSDNGNNGTTEQLIKLNQLGFYPDAPKVAVVPALEAVDSFTIVSDSGTEVFQGTLGIAEFWPHAEENVKLADFSSLTDPGNYQLKVEGIEDSDEFTISENVHAELNQAALKGYYYNRSGMEITAAYADKWARPAGHPDTQVQIHSSAASASRPIGTIISAPGGWYDAGDFNKYIVNSGISTYTLLAAYEHFPEHYNNLQTNIPESANNLPDLLDEILWNLDWMLSMQDPADGGVYHKLTTLNFESRLMPHEATSQRYVVQKSTGAALNFAAVMAVASRVFDDYESELPGLTQRCREAAINAWAWAKNNPDSAYEQPADVTTGQYVAPGLNDEFAWAAAELYITTGEDSYYNEFTTYRVAPVTPSWGYVMALAYISLMQHKDQLTAAADINSIQSELINLADSLRTGASESAFGIALGGEGNQSNDFVWGSNAMALNQSLVLIQAYRHTNEVSYLQAALANMDYALGRNAVDISFVTGFGHRSPMDIHHRQSSADNVPEPVPGLLAGGPHSGQQDGCAYESNLPAKSYLDDWCSYSTNEIAINWNAVLVYVSGALEVLY